MHVKFLFTIFCSLVPFLSAQWVPGIIADVGVSGVGPRRINQNLEGPCFWPEGQRDMWLQTSPVTLTWPYLNPPA